MSANAQIVQNVYDAIARGDGPAVLGAFDSQIVWMEAENIPYADRNPYRGPGEVAEGILGRLGTEWDGSTIHVDRLVTEGDTVVMLGRYTGRYRATGRQLNAQVVHVWTVRDGRIIGFQQYSDTAQFQRVCAVTASALA